MNGFKIGYCPWCGAEIEVESFSPHLGELDWGKCRSGVPCRGHVVRIVTDTQGFIKHPIYLRGKYVHSRKKR